MANKTFHIPKSAIVKSEDNVSILEGKQQTITTDASAVATLTNTDGFKAAHYSIAAERDGEVTTTTTTTTTTVTGSGGIDADTKLLLNANYIYDESFSKRDITLNNTEVVRKGYYFSTSASDSIEVDNSSDFNFGTDDFTIETWVNYSSYTENDGIIGMHDGTSNNRLNLYIADSSGTKKFFFMYVKGGSVLAGYRFGTPSQGEWNHVAICRDSNGWRFYVNGVEDTAAQAFNGTGYSSNADFSGLTSGPFIGKTYNGDFNGYMSDIRISKGTARYTADFDEVVTTKDSNHKLILTGETTDQSDSSHTLTFSGAHPTAKYGQGSFFCGGADSFIKLPASDDYDFGTGDWTFEAWINRLNQDRGDLFYSNWAGGSAEYWIIGCETYNGANRLYLNTRNQADLLANTTFPFGEWHHIAVVMNSGTLTLYLDGVNVGSTTSLSTYNFSISDGENKFIGAYVEENETQTFGTPESSFGGYISDVRISKGVARYTAAFNDDLPTAPLEAEDSRTKLLLNTNSALQDFEIGRMASAPTYAGDTTVIRRGYYFNNSTSGLNNSGTAHVISLSNGTDTFSPGTGNFTMEFWINPDRTPTDTYQNILSSNGYYTNGVNGGWNLYLVGTDLYFYHSDGKNADLVFEFVSAGISVGKWQHVAIVRDGGNSYKLYVDGALKGSDTMDSTRSYTQPPAEIGRTATTSGYYSYYKGYLSDIRLSEEAVYTSAFTPPESLTAGTNTKLLLTGGEEDDSDVGHTLTFQNDAHPTAKFGDGAYYFDGSGDAIFCESDAFLGSELFAGDFTIECWTSIERHSTAARTLWSKSRSGMGYELAWRESQDEWSFNVKTYNNTNSQTQTDLQVLSYAGDAPSLGNWQHIAVTKSGDNFYLTIDGVLRDTGNTNLIPSDTTADQMTIGGYDQTGNDNIQIPIKGYIDDFRISKGVALYTASFDVPTSELGSGTGTTTSTETTTTTTTGSSDVVLTKVHLVHDGSNVYFTEYGRTATDDDFLELSASYDAGVAKLHASTTSGSATLELTKKEFDFSTD